MGTEKSDVIDQCMVCGKEIPPGPDCCSDECEVKMLRKELQKWEDAVSAATGAAVGSRWSAEELAVMLKEALDTAKSRSDECDRLRKQLDAANLGWA